MAELYSGLEEVPTYYDRRTCTSLEDWNEAVRMSRAVYVGNLNYFTTEEELYEVRSNEINLFAVFLHSPHQQDKREIICFLRGKHAKQISFIVAEC